MECEKEQAAMAEARARELGMAKLLAPAEDEHYEDREPLIKQLNDWWDEEQDMMSRASSNAEHFLQEYKKIYDSEYADLLDDATARIQAQKEWETLLALPNAQKLIEIGRRWSGMSPQDERDIRRFLVDTFRQKGDERPALRTKEEENLLYNLLTLKEEENIKATLKDLLKDRSPQGKKNAKTYLDLQLDDGLARVITVKHYYMLLEEELKKRATEVSSELEEAETSNKDAKRVAEQEKAIKLAQDSEFLEGLVSAEVKTQELESALQEEEMDVVSFIGKEAVVWRADVLEQIKRLEKKWRTLGKTLELSTFLHSQRVDPETMQDSDNEESPDEGYDLVSPINTRIGILLEKLSDLRCELDQKSTMLNSISTQYFKKLLNIEKMREEMEKEKKRNRQNPLEQNIRLRILAGMIKNEQAKEFQHHGELDYLEDVTKPHEAAVAAAKAAAESTVQPQESPAARLAVIDSHWDTELDKPEGVLQPGGYVVDVHKKEAFIRGVSRFAAMNENELISLYESMDRYFSRNGSAWDALPPARNTYTVTIITGGGAASLSSRQLAKAEALRLWPSAMVQEDGGTLKVIFRRDGSHKPHAGGRKTRRRRAKRSTTRRKKNQNIQE